MSDKKTKVKCSLTTRGTNKVNAQVVDDLKIPDPETAIGKQIVEEAMKEDTENDGQQEGS